MLLLEQNTTRKERMDKNITKFGAGDNKKCTMEAIWNSTFYGNKAKSHLPNLYYLVAWKKYPVKKNI